MDAKTICSWKTQTHIQVQDITLPQEEKDHALLTIYPHHKLYEQGGPAPRDALFLVVSPIRDHLPISTGRGRPPSCISPHCWTLNVPASNAELTKNIAQNVIKLSSVYFTNEELAVETFRSLR